MFRSENENNEIKASEKAKQVYSTLIPRSVKKKDSASPVVSGKSPKSSLFNPLPKHKQQEINFDNIEPLIKSNPIPAATPKNIPYSEELHLIGRIARFISTLSIDNELHRYAKCYGLVLIGVLAENSFRFLGSSNIKLISDHHGFRSLETTLKQAVDIRNLLADFYIRIPDLSTLLFCDSELNALSVLDTDNEKQNLGSLAGWKLRAEGIEVARKTPIKFIHRLAYLLDALHKIKQFSQYDPEIKSDITVFAMAMLYVIVGTCARECLDKLSDGKMKEHLQIFKLIRDNEFAHYDIIGKNTETLRKSIAKTNSQLDNFISGIQAEIQSAESMLDQKYENVKLKAVETVIPQYGLQVITIDCKMTAKMEKENNSLSNLFSGIQSNT